MEIETLLEAERPVLERFLRLRLPTKDDAEDVLQEVLLTAYRKHGTLRDEARFRPWLYRIARNRVNDWYRTRRDELEPEAAETEPLCAGEESEVVETLRRLPEGDRKLLYLLYWRELPQAEAARRLGVPLGTVKSRLFAAKKRFRKLYPIPPRSPREVTEMKEMPQTLPKYTVRRLDKQPFSVKWEELQGWMIVPRLGEKLRWGLYEQPNGARTEWTEMEVVGKAEIHGIEGVEIRAMQFDAEDYFRTGSVDRMERRFIAQLTDDHSRFLAEWHTENGVKKLFTFLDGDAFLGNWGFGPENIGNETDLRRKGVITREGNTVTAEAGAQTLDVVGRYEVEILGKVFDTVCVMDVECFNDAVVSEQFIDRNGRTVLWRRFNRDDWAFSRYKKRWTEMLPENERITVNGETFVHWYDCVSDYVF